MSAQPSPSVILPPDIYRQIVDHLQSALPNEGCGLLGRYKDADGTQILQFHPGVNIDHSPKRYTMAPAEVLAFFKQARTLDEELYAVVHSHPSSPPRPSPTDLREVGHPDALMLIVSFQHDSPVSAAWRLEGEMRGYEVQEVPVVIVPDDPAR